MVFRRQDRFWNQLLMLIAKGNVVPVVGEDLLYTTDESNNIYSELAVQYADYHKLQLLDNQENDLSSIVRCHPEFRDNPYDIYQDIGELFKEWNPEIPIPLIQLARIKHFNLFVSTSFDDLLEKAINKERFNGKKLTKVLTYSPKGIPSDRQVTEALTSGNPVIFQLFGNYKNPLQFALTEGDKVEYMHALQSSEYSPKRMLAELHERPLLLLGNKFPDWLSRSFLRMTRKTSLDHRDVPKQYFADTIAPGNTYLKSFLHSFTANTEFEEEREPIQFVEDLFTKWQNENTNTTNELLKPVKIDKQNKAMPKNAVFISYCSENKKEAMALSTGLKAANIEVWMDIEQLRVGDKYERKIERYIKTCSVFIPIISTTSDFRTEGFFRKEWNWALNRLPNFTGADRQFILPVALGNIDPYSAKVPAEFKKCHFYLHSVNSSFSDFIETVESIYRDSLNKQ